MPKMRLPPLWLGCAFVAVLITSLVAFVTVTAPRRDIDRFMPEVGAIEIGKTKLEDWHHRVAEADQEAGTRGLACPGVFVFREFLREAASKVSG
jgi:hypothetical protein